MTYKNLITSAGKSPIPVRLACIAFLICIPLMALNVIPQTDCAARYAPMTEAFAAENWRFAFHPRIPPFFTTTSGIFAWLTGCDGFTATKITSVLFFALGIFPLYGIFRNTFDQRTATAGVILYTCCSHLLRLSYSGLRDTARSFAFLLTVYGLIYIYKHRKGMSGYVYCGLGCAGLSLLRGDCLIYAVIFLCVALIAELFDSRRLHIPYRSIVAICLFALLITPWLIYEYRIIGYPVTESRIAVVLIRVEKKLGIEWIYNKNAEVSLPGKPLNLESQHHCTKPKHQSAKNGISTINSLPTASAPSSDGDRQPIPEQDDADPHIFSAHVNADTDSIGDFIDSFFKGFYPYFFLFAIPVILFRIKQKSWTRLETVVLAALVGHALIQVGQIAVSDHRLYVSRRYLLPAAPLSFGWSAMGMKYVYDVFSRRFSFAKTRRFYVSLLIFLFAALYMDGAERIIKSYSSTKKRERKESVFACANWIKNNYHATEQYSETIPLHYSQYHSGKKPIILTREPAVGYFARGHSIDPRMVSGSPEEVIKQNQVDFIVLNSEAPEFDVNKISGIKKAFSSELDCYGMDVFPVKRQ